MSERAHHRLAGQDGFGLIEVLVTAVLVVVIATGVLAALDAASHASGRTKARDAAATFAQADQERMRTMTLAQLSNLDETQPKQSCDEDGGTCLTYQVKSRAYWVSDKSGTQTCTGTSAQVSYLKLVSTVSWPSMGSRKPVVSESMLAPRATALAGDQGSLAVKLVRADGVTPLAGVQVTLTGPKSLSGTTNAQGCVLWGYLPAGNGYTVSFNQAGHVDVNGVQNVADPVGIVAQSLNSRTYLYDRSATARVSFASTIGTTKYTGQVADAVTLGQSQMSPTQRVVTAPGGTAVPGIDTPALFPFKTGSPGGPYSIYAGDCTAESPVNQSPQVTPNFVPNLNPGDTNVATEVSLPPLDTKIKVNGGPPTAANDAKLRVVPKTVGCVNPAWTAVSPLSAITTGTEAGRPQLPTSSTPAIGFPYGTYRVCAQATVSGVVRRAAYDAVLSTVAGAKVPSGAQVPSGGTAGEINLRFTGTASQLSTPGNCNASV
jgi:Tfp pilus assembly protein PilV